MNYIKSEKYQTPDLMKKIMGPNPLKLEEELLMGHKIKDGVNGKIKYTNSGHEKYTTLRQ